MRCDDHICSGTIERKAASKHLSSLIRPGDVLELVFDVAERDRYGRLLAYVLKDGEMLNKRMVADGYASPLTVPPNIAHADEFARLFDEARRAKRGLWAD